MSVDETSLPRSRAEAKELGMKRYFTGKPCKHGHVDERHTSSGQCIACARSSQRKSYPNRASKLKMYQAEYRAANPEQIKAYAKSWRIKNPERAAKKIREWKEANPDYRLKNIDHFRAKDREYQAKRRATPKGRVDDALSAGIRDTLKRGEKRGTRWELMVGYSVDALMRHLERLFQPGMSWKNYGRGGWHIDHIIPRSAFNYETPEDIDFRRCWALDNLQPLWEFDNISKGARLDKPFQPSLAIAAKLPQQETETWLN